MKQPEPEAVSVRKKWFSSLQSVLVLAPSRYQSPLQYVEDGQTDNCQYLSKVILTFFNKIFSDFPVMVINRFTAFKHQKMGLKFSLFSLFTIILGPRTEAWPEDCSASSKSNDLKTSALLYAHRCYLKVGEIVFHLKCPKLQMLAMLINIQHFYEVEVYVNELQFEKEKIICNLKKSIYLFRIFRYQFLLP